MLKEVDSGFYKLFKQNVDKILQDDAQDMRLVLHAEGQDVPFMGEHCLPTNSHVASLIPVRHSGMKGIRVRDIVLALKNSTVQHMNNIHRNFDALHYVLLFPHRAAKIVRKQIIVRDDCAWANP